MEDDLYHHPMCPCPSRPACAMLLAPAAAPRGAVPVLTAPTPTVPVPVPVPLVELAKASPNPKSNPAVALAVGVMVSSSPLSPFASTLPLPMPLPSRLLVPGPLDDRVEWLEPRRAAAAGMLGRRVL